MTEKFAYIETFGCQMNERDSEIMGQLLSDDDFAPTEDIYQADVIIVNTCSIRAKAEQKAYSLLGRLKRMKQKNPSLVVAVAGCVAQQDGKKLLKRMPFVDLVIGPQNIYNLPGLIKNLPEKTGKNGNIKVWDRLSPAFEIPPFLPAVDKGSPFKRFVTIMQGCNNYCTYCVVPYTRGREISRKFEDIVHEIEHLANSGIREVTLLGQNVNSYGRDRSGKQHHTFPDLLQAVAGIDGIKRIRFTTSHPKDLSEELMRCFAELDKLCPHFHLPVQSGSNKILKKMNRKYTVESYLDKVRKLKEYRPDIALTTDIIVGFPGETDKDFGATMELLDTVRFHGAFSFKYSDRPHAKSSSLIEKVPEEEKSVRLNQLQARQEEITQERHREYIGSIMEVMVEGESKSAAGQWSGRTTTNHIVNFDSPAILIPGQTAAFSAMVNWCRPSMSGASKS